jgi:hypothetical protein
LQDRFMIDASTQLLSVLDHLSLGHLADPHWEGALFQKQTWDPLMNFLRMFLTFAGAMLVLYELRSDKMGEWLSQRVRRNIAIVFSVLAFGAYFDFGNPNVRYAEYIHRHEFFHYYLGSKYFEELGYKRIYECTAAAEMELGRATQVKNRELRDLRENLIKKNTAPDVQQHIEECREIFSKKPERWAAFKQDVDWFYKSSAGSYWDNMQKDHGYNPPPVWTMAGKFWSSLGTANLDFFKYLSAIDIVLHVGIVLLVFWSFGWRVGAIATVWWGCNYPANFYWTGGAFMRQDWFFFLTASFCLAHKRKFGLAGAALVWASLLRVFPMLLFAGVGMIIVIRFVMSLRQGKGFWAAIHPDHKRFLAGCIIALGVLVPTSMAVTNGVTAYKDFFAHTLGTHNHTPLTNHMGLKTLMVHDWGGRMRFTRNDSLDDPFRDWKGGRTERAQATRHLRHGIVLLLGLWMAWALRRERFLWVGMALSLPIAMSLVELTCYYYTMFIAAAALAKVRREYGAIVLMSSGASQVLGSNVHNLYYFIDDKFAAQSWLFFVFSLSMLYAFSRPFSLERLKRWWHFKAEAAPRASSSVLRETPSPAE